MATAALEAVLASAKKGGEWSTNFSTLINAPALTLDALNAVPPGRSFGVIHQIAYWGSVEGLKIALTRFPGLNLALTTKQGQTPLQVATENKRADFQSFLSGLLAAQAAQAAQAAALAQANKATESGAAANPVALALVEAAKNGKWTTFRDLLSDEKKVDVALLNVVPQNKRWGVIHQLAYWGKTDELDFVSKKFGSSLNLALQTSEPTPQTALDIAKGKGHKDFATALALNSIFVSAFAEMTLKTPIIRPETLDTTLNCIVCLEEFPKGTTGVVCTVSHHFLCQPCFGDYIVSESNVDSNTSGILLKGGVVFCPAEKIKDGCQSPAFSNQVVASNVSEATYDLYLKARDFVVGKDAAAKALQKLAGGLSTVEQEQIRNLFRNPDGSYRAFMCKHCKFGPVDHGWCGSLGSHHGEQKAGGGTVSNACPRCNWFVPNISQWPKWDGQFVAYNGPKLAGAPVPQLPMPIPLPHLTPYPCVGRPFSVAGGALCSPLMPQASTWNIAENLVFAKKQDTGRSLLNEEEALAVGRYWARCAQGEHASVASFARHTLELMAVGAPPSILQQAQQAGMEEVGHAKLCFALAKKYGVEAHPGPFPLPASSTPSLLDMLLGVATEGCVAEFGSCIVASLQAARATAPAVKSALEQIAREEAGHCVLAWRTLCWGLQVLSGAHFSQISMAFEKALKAESDALLHAQAEKEGDARLLNNLAARLPGMGILSQKEEADLRCAVAQKLTTTWATAVLQGHRPSAPQGQLGDKALLQAVTQVHQAIFYLDPIPQ